MFDFFIQYRSFSDGKWTTIAQDKAVNGQSACHMVGEMQKSYQDKMGEVGDFRAKPISVPTPL